MLLLFGVAAATSHAQLGAAYKWDMPADQVQAFEGAQIASGSISIEFEKGMSAAIVTDVGVTGLTVVAPGRLVMKIGDGPPVLEYPIHGAMLRFDPNDREAIFVAENPDDRDDPGFAAMAKSITLGVFRHCWHSGWNALIPPPGTLSVCHFSAQEGDVNAWDDGNGYGAYNFTTKTELVRGTY